MSVALFIGDGKQEVVDMVFAGTSVLTMSVAAYYLRPVNFLPKMFIHALLLLSVYYLISVVFSVSPGYSFSETLRIFSSFLVLYTAYTYSHAGAPRALAELTVCFGLFAAIASIIYTAFQQYLPPLSSMNLLLYTYGHNHIVDIMVFAVPAILALAGDKRRLRRAFILVFFIAVSVWSGSRAGVVAVALSAVLYYLFDFVSTSGGKKPIGLKVAIIGLAVSVLVFFYINHSAPEKPRDPGVAAPGQKLKIIDDGRIGYWKQAWRGFLEKPVFGAGPGTFYLTSKRLQESQLAYSWFPHNQILKTLSETGFVGLLIWGGVMIISLQTVVPEVKKHGLDPYRRAAAASVAAILIYSLVEYHLEYAVVVCLFYLHWAIIIIPQRAIPAAVTPKAICLPVIFVGFGYLSYIVSLVFRLSGQSALVVFYTAPYHADRARLSLNAARGDAAFINPVQLGLLNFFHPHDSDLLLALAYAYEKNDNKHADELFRSSIEAEPKNEKPHKEYLLFLYRSGKINRVWEAVRLYADNFLPGNKRRWLFDLSSPSETDLLEEKERVTDGLFDSAVIHEIRFMKLVYSLGHRHLTTDRATALQYWNAAQEIFPLSQPLHDDLVLLAKELGDTGTLGWRCGGKGERADFSGYCAASFEGVPGDRKAEVLAFPDGT